MKLKKSFFKNSIKNIFVINYDVPLCMAFKAGFVNILGPPNAGKSTLVNRMLGDKISIVTPKAQTTRHRILGIETTSDYQLILSDTPGIIIKPAYELHKRMMNFVHESLEDADVLVFLTDITDHAMPDSSMIEKIKALSCPIILCLNKSDLDTKNLAEERKKDFSFLFPGAEIHVISALHGSGTDELKKSIIEKLPEHPPYFDSDQLTDKTERFILSEIIREKIFLLYAEEIPYSCEVMVTDFKEKENILYARAEIWVEKESQKIIIIGKNGSKIKKLGTQARTDAEQFFGKKMFLELYVKVKKDWRKNASLLNQLGYQT